MFNGIGAFEKAFVEIINTWREAKEENESRK